MRDRVVLAGRYRLDELIGSGSFSEVWRALDLTTAERVAVKTAHVSLYPDDAAGRAARDLVQEAAILRLLDHPNIVRVLDAGDEGGRPFVVMEYLEGPSLRSLLLEGGRLDEAFATHGASRVASALDAVHQRGIVHNDVKPENIIMVDGEPHLADFGVARDLRATLLPQQASELAGTLAYIAPEVLAGEQPGPSADLYALAVTLYECVAGRTPFAGTSALRAAAGLGRDPAPLQQVAPDATLHLDRFLARALSGEPSTRFQTAAAFHGALPGSWQPTVRFTREPSQPPPGSVAPRSRVAYLPRVVAGIGVAAILFAGAMLLSNGGLFPGPADDDLTNAVDAPSTATPSPDVTIESTPAATATPQPTEPPADDNEGGGNGNNGNGNGPGENNGRGNGAIDRIEEGVVSARDSIEDFLNGLNGAADDFRNRFNID